MSPGRPVLQDFDCSRENDRNDGSAQPILWIGQSEGEADQNEGQRVLTVLTEVGMRSKARRAKCGEGDGSGK